MNSSTKQYINELAQQVINVYDITIPINDLENVVRSMGGEIEERAEFDDFCDGTIMKSNSDGFRIVIPRNQYPQRKTFTIAHELGHLFLHMGFRTNRELWDSQDNRIYRRFGTSEQEYQANEFAASLLMPMDRYKKIVSEYAVNGTVDMARVANYFNVSIAAATNRGLFLGILHE